MIAHSHDDDDVLCCCFLGMCKGWKIVSLFRDEKQQSALLLGGSKVCVRKFSLIFFRDSRRESSFLHGVYGWLEAKPGRWSRAIVSFSLLRWESHRVKVLNTKIDVLSRGNITAKSYFSLSVDGKASGVFQFTQKRVLKRIFQIFCVSPAWGFSGSPLFADIAALLVVHDRMWTVEGTMWSEFPEGNEWKFLEEKTEKWQSERQSFWTRWKRDQIL